MHIERHKLEDRAIVERKFNQAIGDLPMYVAKTKRVAINLSILLSESLAIVTCGSVIEPQSPRIREALQLAAQASAGIFAASTASTSNPVQVHLGEGEAAVYTSPPAPSTVNVAYWVQACYLNVICGNDAAIDALCQIPPESIVQPKVSAPEYSYLRMKALQSYFTGRRDVIELLMAALRATDPERDDIFNKTWTLSLDVPQIEVLIYLASKDAKFGDALFRAVKSHKEYWSNTPKRRRDWDGFISIPLEALAIMGRARQLVFEVDSPYLRIE